jgi:branched-chain amino acid aminotransferase
MMVSSFTRLHPNINMTKSKVAGNYVNSMLVKTLALRSGYDEAVILDPNGYVAECTGENLFMIRRGALLTPPLSTVLEGITRDSVITLARDMGLQIWETQITRDQLYTADEVFITGTAAEVVGVRAIDTRTIGEGCPGPITRRISQEFVANLHGEGRYASQWLDYLI